MIARSVFCLVLCAGFLGLAVYYGSASFLGGLTLGLSLLFAVGSAYFAYKETPL